MENNESRYVGRLMKIKEPAIIKNILDEKDYKELADYLFYKPKLEEHYAPGLSRYIFTDEKIDEVAKKITPIARKFFESNTLLPSYSLFSHYQGNASLFRHIDDNACTYTLDMCVYQNEPWDLGINHNNVDKKYTLMPNEALAYYGNNQEHWRDDFPNPNFQYVAMIFFHFVEPDHWFHAKGPSYLDVVRNIISEEEWQKRQP